MASIELFITNKTKYRLGAVPFKRLLAISQSVLKLVLEDLSLVILSAGEMRKVNQLYRGENKPATVLSFDYGEILLCPAVISKKYQLAGSALKEKILTLFVHGLVHLAGADHQTKAQAAAMSVLEEKILNIFAQQN